jgi:sucrose-phosphate synthase
MDKGWMKHINYAWNADAIRNCLADIDGIEAQDPADQNPFKISYFVHDKDLTADQVTEHLGRLARNVSVVITQSAYLDILPKRASKGRAVRYIGNKWSIPINEVVVCGDAGNDIDMFTGASGGIVVGNHAPEMESLRGLKRVYFSQAHSAAGVLEGLRNFEFLK